ncbi:hypothetical protein DFS34DRAFT_124200 [Phlyctochytrium arcticum]|nr:hypothetical protein DFS34DRAFT_124200 [Phlyctochytrium arcticum]
MASSSSACGEPPQPPLPPDQRKILLVFIHGFLGSEESFFTFPPDLVTTVEKNYPNLHGKVEFRTFPRYDTRGHNAQAVRKLMKWLEIYATTGRYSCVILLAHSMGGLLAADAYQWIYTPTEKKPPKQSGKKKDGKPAPKTPPATPASATAAASSDNQTNVLSRLFGSFGIKGKAPTPPSEQYPPGEAAPEDESTTDAQAPKEPEGDAPDSPRSESDAHPDSEWRHLINIRGILAFDSPFYGLHTNVFTQAGSTKAYAVLTDGIYNAKTYLPAALTAASTLAPRAIDVPTGLPVIKTVPLQTSWVLQVANSAINRFNATDTTAAANAAGAASDAPSTPVVVVPDVSMQESVPAGGSTETVDGSKVAADSSVDQNSADKSDGAPGAPATPAPSQFPTWARYAVGGAALAATAYATLSVAPLAAAYIPVSILATRAAGTFAINSVEHVRDHLHFLYPLAMSQKEMHQRVHILRQEMELRQRVIFRGFFLQLSSSTLVPMQGVDMKCDEKTDDSTGSTPGSSSQQSNLKLAEAVPAPDAQTPQPTPTNNDGKSADPPKRCFCNPPPADVSHLFQAVDHPATNEIDAHMALFSSEFHTYPLLLSEVAKAVHEIWDREQERKLGSADL